MEAAASNTGGAVPSPKCGAVRAGRTRAGASPPPRSQLRRSRTAPRFFSVPRADSRRCGSRPSRSRSRTADRTCQQDERISPMNALRTTVRRALCPACATALLVTALPLGEATAGDCTAPKQEYDEATKNQIRVRNETLRDIAVVFYRTDESETQKKATEIVKSGKQTQYNFGLGGTNGDAVGIARISINGTAVLKSTASVSNTYSKKSGEQVTEWSRGKL